MDLAIAIPIASAPSAAARPTQIPAAIALLPFELSLFSVGAGSGYLLQKTFGNYAIMFSAALTFIASFAFIGKENADVEKREEVGQEEVGKSDKGEVNL